MNEWAIPGGRGGKMRFWANKSNTLNYYLRATKDGAKSVKHGNSIRLVIENKVFDTIYHIQYWKDSLHSGGPAYDPVGIKNARHSAKEGMIAFPNLDSITIKVKYVKKNK